MARKKQQIAAEQPLATQPEMFPQLAQGAKQGDEHDTASPFSSLSHIAEVKKMRADNDKSFVKRRRGVWNRSKLAQTAMKPTGPPVRQGTDTDEDPFHAIYGVHKLLEPAISFSTHFDMVEASDILQVCISLVADAVDGNGHTFQYLGKDKKRSKEDDENRQTLVDFFSNPNEMGGFVKVRRPLRIDLESVGNAAAEVVRDKKNVVDLLYHLPITYMRMTLPDDEATPYQAKVLRNGKLVTVTRYKRFRRYCRVFPSGIYQWFKEFGDPRTVDRDTGEYVTYTPNPATECWWFKISSRNQHYGMPRWYPLQDIIKARILAHYINYTVFTSQGCPPVMIAVEGGRLTDGSVKELEETVESWKSVDSWNSTVVLQAEPLDDFALSDKGVSKPTIQIHQLRGARAEDAQFERFLNYSEALICRCWRLPALLRGAGENLNLASASASQIVAEQYLFIPLRQDFDETVNFRLLRQEFGIWNWDFKSLAVKTTGSEELAKVIRTVALSGGATMNNVVDLANDMLGTNWSKDDSPISEIPVVWALALARLGRIHITPDKKIVVLTPQQAQGLQPLPGESAAQPVPSTDTDVTPAGVTIEPPVNGEEQAKNNRTKFKMLMSHVEDEAFKRMMSQVEEEFENWEPSDIEDADFAMQV